MSCYRADMHIHTILSPCGSLEMSPVNIIQTAASRGLDIIGITDHNTTRQCQTIADVAAERGITVICGAEINTHEEIHCLALFGNASDLAEFQVWLDTQLPDVKNDPDKFGDQIWVDADENIVGEEGRLLISALDATLEEAEKAVHRLNGLFIAAHADKSRNSIISQLGFIPGDIRFDAIELSPHTTTEEFLKRHPYLKDYTFITASDAHYLHQMGSAFTSFELASPDFESLKLSLKLNQGVASHPHNRSVKS
ncbi:MAG: PHP domain-containing protein [Breznakibacter sp.]